MAKGGLLEFTLAAVTYRFAFGISRHRSLNLQSRVEVVHLHPTAIHADVAFFEPDIPSLRFFNSLVTFPPKAVLVLQLPVGPHVPFRPSETRMRILHESWSSMYKWS